MKYLNKSFSIERVKAEYLAKKFGTPIYCYSYKKLKTNIINFKNNFKSFKPLICFSVKSNTNVHLLREIKKLGCGADVVSIGELMKALKAGVNAKKIVFSGVGKTTEELNYAINKNILLQTIIYCILCFLEYLRKLHYSLIRNRTRTTGAYICTAFTSFTWSIPLKTPHSNVS